MRVGLNNLVPYRKLGTVEFDEQLPSDAVIKKIAADRFTRKYGPSRRVGKKGETPVDYDLWRAREIAAYVLGMKGERAVARSLQVPMNLQNYDNRGDHRTNLTTLLGVPVDVVTAEALGTECYDDRRIPDLRLRVVEKPRNDLALVLCVWLGDSYEPLLFGWLWEVELRRLDKRKTFVEGKNTENFTASPSQLRPFETLRYAKPGTAPIERAEQPSLFGVAAEKVDSRVWQGRQ